jgi:hypothetical protein
MRLTLAATVVGAALAAFSAPSASPSPNAVNACSLLAKAIRADPYWSIHLTKRSFIAAGGGSWRCELTSVPPKGSVSAAFLVLLTFFASPSASVAHQNLSVSPDPPARGTGADEALAREKHQGGATNTRVTWRKGRYWGWLSVQGPKLVGDLDDARDLLRAFVRLLPRT